MSRTICMSDIGISLGSAFLSFQEFPKLTKILSELVTAADLDGPVATELLERAFAPLVKIEKALQGYDRNNP